MTKQINPDYKSPEREDVLVKSADSEYFEIGQSYDKEAATTLACAKCGSVEFNVGQGDYFTAIRCPICLWQLCIHDG
jgi:hypothetical protein